MSRNNLPRIATPDALPADQQTALAALVAGQTVTAAAAAAGASTAPPCTAG